MMTTIRSSPRTATNTTRLIVYAAVLALLFLSVIFFQSNNSKLSHQSQHPPATDLASVHSMMASHKQSLMNTNSDHDPMTIILSEVSYLSTSLSYYHCGPHPPDTSTTEVILLHGAAFTKEDWKTSSILDKLCELNNDEDGGDISISALDLPVSADGKELEAVFDALVQNGILSGRSVVVLTPSASGKSVVSLAQMMMEGGEGKETLKKIVKAWIPVAPPSVLQAPDSTFEAFTQLSIPVLAIHGDQDTMGKKVTAKLEKLVNANGVELKGRHPVYLDSSVEFVEEILRFLESEGL